MPLYLVSQASGIQRFPSTLMRVLSRDFPITWGERCLGTVLFVCLFQGLCGFLSCALGAINMGNSLSSKPVRRETSWERQNAGWGRGGREMVGPILADQVRSPFLLRTELHPTQIYTSTQSETPSISGSVCFWRCLFRRWLRSNCQHPLDHRKSTRVPEKHLLLLYWLRQSL